jgi:hypothetical protein
MCCFRAAGSGDTFGRNDAHNDRFAHTLGNAIGLGAADSII